MRSPYPCTNKQQSAYFRTVISCKTYQNIPIRFTHLVIGFWVGGFYFKYILSENNDQWPHCVSVRARLTRKTNLADFLLARIRRFSSVSYTDFYVQWWGIYMTKLRVFEYSFRKEFPTNWTYVQLRRINMDQGITSARRTSEQWRKWPCTVHRKNVMLGVGYRRLTWGPKI